MSDFEVAQGRAIIEALEEGHIPPFEVSIPFLYPPEHQTALEQHDLLKAAGYSTADLRQLTGARPLQLAFWRHRGKISSPRAADNLSGLFRYTSKMIRDGTYHIDDVVDFTRQPIPCVEDKNALELIRDSWQKPVDTGTQVADFIDMAPICNQDELQELEEALSAALHNPEARTT